MSLEPLCCRVRFGAQKPSLTLSITMVSSKCMRLVVVKTDGLKTDSKTSMSLGQIKNSHKCQVHTNHAPNHPKTHLSPQISQRTTPSCTPHPPPPP